MSGSPPPPPRLGSDADRQILVASLARAGFCETSVCAQLGIPDFDALEGHGRVAILAKFDASDPLGLLTRLFVLGGATTVSALAVALSPHEFEAFRSAGLLSLGALASGEDEQVFAPLRLVPLSDGSNSGQTILIASDRGDHPDGSRFEPFPDIVFSGHNPLTRQFLKLLPTRALGSVLDLCSGTGVDALVAAVSASRVAAVDVTRRCTEFARFNCWLNGDDRVDVRQGDLFEPVRGERFDCVIAHPPYVPALSQNLIYRDGGETGDRLVRRIFEGMPGCLNVGGSFHILSIGMDTEEAPFEARVREWLGDAAPEFDIVFAFGSSMTAPEFARSLVTRSAGSLPGDYERWIELFERLRVREVVYGATVGKRFDAGSGQAQTRRFVAAPSMSPDAFEWLFQWFDWLRAPDRQARVLESRPRVSGTSEVDVSHVVEKGRFVPQRFRLSNPGAPFRVQLDTDGWVVSALNAFDGQQRARDVYAAGKRAGSLPSELGEADFVDVVCLLAERGFLLDVAGHAS